MGHLDILFFAAVAAFALFKLWNVLGKTHDEDKDRPNPFTPQDDTTHGRDVVVRAESAKPPSPPLLAQEPPLQSLAGGLAQIKKLDESFDEKTFAEGAKTAFTMIVEDFMKGDLSHSARLLAEPVRAQFMQAIAARSKEGQTLDGKVDAVITADPIAARVEGTRAFITVDFLSRQTNILKDASGTIVSGKSGKPEDVSDVWVFSRDTASSNPNWQLVETR